MNDGKHLETLVAFVEETMLSGGYTVATNQRIYNDDGIQIAEFDVEVRGKLGTTEIMWLIECRDRPGSGPAPGSWIEQLVGRRTRFGFNKVTAVSTTGFAEGAQDFAKQQGIELRVVEALTPDAFSWLRIEHISVVEKRANLVSSIILVKEDIPEEVQVALSQVIIGTDGSEKILHSIKTGELCTLANAFLGAIEHHNLFSDVKPNTPVKQVALHVQYINNDDHFEIETELGTVRVEAIVFQGELTITETLIPIDSTNKYRKLDTGQTISQVASFAPQNFAGAQMALEFHRMGDDGETHILLRKITNNT